MNKRLLTVSSLIGLFLVFAFFTTGNSTTTSKKGTPTVGILQLVTHPALDQIHQGVIDGLKAEGYVKGKNIKIDYQNAQADQANLKTMAQNFANKNENLTIGIATPAALSLAKAANGHNPVILGGITNPSGAKLVKSDAHPGGNITGVGADSPYQKQLDVLKEVLPKAKTIGIVSTSSDSGGTYHAKNMTKLLEKNGYKVKNYTIASTNDMQQIATTMVSQVDAVYAPQDNGVATAMKTLVSVANQAHVAVIPAADSMVKDGALATYSDSQYEIGYQAGKIAGQVLKGKKPADIPVENVTKGSYSINQETAKTLGITLPADIVKKAQADKEVF
ncbi:tryptophan ABC transporter substrate-binding protein [Fructobacillus ficulneus]|uniref:ABC transporter substrate-binding protein n=1 Tax=Fructobacillus ficulneus TaxID=157463 RepID=A0A0K8MGX7_9LACO|nr:tryptophan ABC transporter substrate-binding protein [Fructobacillus ficulneus]GAO99129.1 ABC transporter substrate-binding protein [Fructobacillus ficulneus]